MWSPSIRSPQLSRGAGMDACECSGGARPEVSGPSITTGSLALRAGPLGNVVPSGPVARGAGHVGDRASAKRQNYISFETIAII
ncbi:hypothetical protein NDU88_007211 [Pleurodeles waltl]|uniref:Uncharacterized protein n=1 Tax=Pleurodeles waltl TaxID=8319 RepID=A0AAV7RTE7_PLEWA|nr:hypothetical protein NDU88_007211 [Pleurodeles waltl]